MAVIRPDLAAVTYVALKPLKVGSSTRQRGEAVPEAATWRNLSSYISAGKLAVVSPENHPAIPKAKTTKANRERVGREAGTGLTHETEYLHYSPVDHTGAKATVPKGIQTPTA